MADFLYIHFPFCVRKCRYCDFYSLPYAEDAAARYCSAVCLELRLRSHQAGRLRTVYLGGGTPSLLDAGSINSIFSSLRTNFRFYPEAEFSIEMNPGTVTREKLDAMISAGINRFSLGVQSFNDDELKLLGRLHTADDARSAITMMRRCGITNFSIDLIYGIPGQTTLSWEATLAETVSQHPAHVSAYELTPEKGTPLSDDLGSGVLRLPDEEHVVAMADKTMDFLSSAGLQHYEVSNYARPGFECIHNINYWNCGNYLGVGAGAHSFVNDVRSQNVGDIESYCDLISKSRLPVSGSYEVSGDEALREYLFLGLRKTEGIMSDRLRQSGIMPEIQYRELIGEGLLSVSGDTLRLSRKGMMIANTVLLRLFDLSGL